MPTTRREFLFQSAALGILGLAGMSPVARAMAQELQEPSSIAGRKKNVLFIAVDDLRPELGCYGHPIVKSPNIDALARGGVVFERTYCQQAVCGPTRASLLTGCRPDTTRVYDLSTHIRRTMPNVVTLQQHFKNNGYVSVGMGKLFHNGLEDQASYSRPHRYAGGRQYATDANVERQKRAKASGKRWGGAEATECADVPDDTYSDGVLAAMAIESLRELAPKVGAANGPRQPFFLGVGFAKPHLPFCAPKKYWDLYDRSRIPLPYPDKPKNAPGIAFTNWGELRNYSDIPSVGPCDEAKTRELIHGYYACVSFLDANVGRLLAELDRLDLRKDTIIVLWGDHGWKLGEYSMWCKHTNFELDTHVPMIIADPDTPKDKRVPALTEFVDIYPTLCELCGLSLPESLEGASLVAVMRDPKRPWKKAAFSQYPREGNIMGYSMRTERYRYTEWQDRKTAEAKFRELYDLDSDPLCKESIVAKPESQPLVAELHAMMKAGWKAARP